MQVHLFLRTRTFWSNFEVGGIRQCSDSLSIYFNIRMGNPKVYLYVNFVFCIFYMYLYSALQILKSVYHFIIYYFICKHTNYYNPVNFYLCQLQRFLGGAIQLRSTQKILQGLISRLVSLENVHTLSLIEYIYCSKR